MPHSLDTENWAEELQYELLRRAGPLRRLEIAGELSAAAWNACRAEIDRLHPHETKDQRDDRFLTFIYGPEIARMYAAERQRRGQAQMEPAGP